MKFAKLAEYFGRIEETPSRNEMMVILAKMLRESGPDEVEQVVNLALGQLRPKFDRLEFSLAEKMIVRSIALAVGKEVDEVTAQYKKMGDLGEVVENARTYEQTNVGTEERMNARAKEDTVGKVYEELVEIAKDRGVGSQERKVGRLAKLIANLGSRHAKYTVRMVMGKLRLGFSDKTVLDALSYLEYGTKEGREELDRAYQVFPDVGKLARYVKEGGVGSLTKKVGVTLGTPVLPALSQRLKTADQMIAKMGEVMCEPKFDGTRVQIHYSKNKPTEEQNNLLPEMQNGLFAVEEPKHWVKTFTRNLDESSAMFPELELIGEQIAANEVILDSEAVGYDPKTGKQVPFQLTITRKRKHGVGEASAEVPLKFNVFDILYLDGKSLLELPLWERRKILEETITTKQRTNKPTHERRDAGTGERNNETTNQRNNKSTNEQTNTKTLVVDECLVTEDAQEIREYHAKKLAEGLEGAMVKKIDGKYLPGRQDWNWVKFKESEDSAAKLSDTLDVVIMGYYKGRGKRTKFGVGAFLAGVRTEEQIVTIAKIGTGLSDKQFQELFARMQECKTETMPKSYQVNKMLVPDVWVEPEIVVEVAADEITMSPAHSSSMALRFPRLIKFREDKDLQGITTVQEVKEIAGF